MAEYTPTVEERREVGAAIGEALAQCGIGVRYAISGPRELFDVASVLLKSDALAAHDRAVKAEALLEAADLRHGTDLTPTIMGNPDPFWWYEYLQRLDEAWRHQLRARADQIEGATE